jgi:hypothetical protein
VGRADERPRVLSLSDGEIVAQECSVFEDGGNKTRRPGRELLGLDKKEGETERPENTSEVDFRDQVGHGDQQE